MLLTHGKFAQELNKKVEMRGFASLLLPPKNRVNIIMEFYTNGKHIEHSLLTLKKLSPYSLEFLFWTLNRLAPFVLS